MAFHIWSHLIWFITLHLWHQSPFDWKHSTYLTDATPLRFLTNLSKTEPLFCHGTITKLVHLQKNSRCRCGVWWLGFQRRKEIMTSNPAAWSGAACEGRQSTFRRVETRMSHISDNLFVLKIFNTTVCAVQTTTWKEAFNQRHPKTRYNKNVCKHPCVSFLPFIFVFLADLL